MGVYAGFVPVKMPPAPMMAKRSMGYSIYYRVSLPGQAGVQTGPSSTASAAGPPFIFSGRRATHVIECMDADTIPPAQTSGFQTCHELFHLLSRLFGGDGSLRLLGVDIDDSILIIALIPKDPRHQIRSILHDGSQGAFHCAGL